MRHFVAVCLLLASSFCSAAVVTVNYSWVASFVSDSEANALLGQTIAGTLTFEEVEAVAADEVKRYNLLSHTVTVDNNPISGIGTSNQKGDTTSSMTVVNNLYGAALGDAVVVQSTTDSEYLGFDLQTFGLLFSDPNSARLDTAGVSKAAIDSVFEFIEGRMLVTTGTKEITVASQGLLIKDTAVEGGSHASSISCPATPDYEDSLYTWSTCDVLASADTTLSDNGNDYIASIRVPKALNSNNKGHLHVFLHPSEGGSGSFATSRSSNQAVYDQIEIHPVNQRYGGNGIGDWWVYSGYTNGDVQNYNGNQIAAMIDYALETYPDKIDLNKGIHLRGTSLGGAGVMHQPMVLPRYQDKVAIVDAQIALMMIPKNHEAQTTAWGTVAQSPEIYDSVDIRTQWSKVVNVHFSWRGGQNDNYDRFDTEFIDICELRKISCSLAWLQSGHSITETGYTMNMDLFTDADMDVSLDVILPVITNNTSNYHGTLRGYHNRGLGWDYDNITETSSTVTIPLRYNAMAAPGSGVPAQPNTATFSVTPRHTSAFVLTPEATVDWVFGGQSGTATVGTDGLVTVDGLTLTSGAGYTNLVLTHGAGGVVGNSIVYTRVPRTVGSFTIQIDGSDYTSDNWDFLDALPEVSRITDTFNGPGQLILREANGTETIIHDCMQAAKPCVPLDPMPSMDGTKIAYTVVQSDGLEPPYPQNKNYPSVGHLNGVNSEAKIYIYDIAADTATVWAGHTPGTHDLNPVWLSDGSILFSTDRDGYREPHILNYNTSNSTKMFRMYKADADGANAVDVSQHELSGALHPYVLDNGRVLYGSHWTTGLLTHYTTNGSLNRPGTTPNNWMLLSMDQRGGDILAEAGAHHDNLSGANAFDSTQKALHFVGQRANGDRLVTNYYRANNNALGSIIGFPDQGYGIEGPAPSFNPAGNYSVATWSTSEDTSSRINSVTGDYYGKIGWPEGDTDGQILLTYGKGYCTHISTAIPSVTNAIGSRTGCDTGLYKTTQIPSTDPSDLQIVVDDPNWHEFNGRIVRSRTVEVATPDYTGKTTGDSTCVMISTDAKTSDIEPFQDYDFNDNYYNTAQNGSQIDGLAHSDVAGIKFLKIIPNTVFGTSDFGNSYGNNTAELGETTLLADGSFKVQLPCDTPFLMLGIDADGRAIKRDQTPQSLRPGEQRVCTGCHRHATPGPAYAPGIDAYDLATAIDLTTETAAPTYTADIKPIFDAKCTACHGPAVDPVTDISSIPLYDYDDLVRDYTQSAVPTSLKVVMRPGHASPTWEFGLHKPYTSKYIHQLYARESPLYWKAKNERTDGRTDSTYSDDLDFGASHATSLTAAEIELIGDWIDSGATE